MTKPIPSVDRYMTMSPHTVGVDQTLAHVRVLMKEYDVRHLPVLRGGELVGMVTERDLALIAQFPDIDVRATKVEEAMSTSIYKIAPETPLDEVVEEMASKKYGSAVVVQNRKVVGIVTNVDVCFALASLLRGHVSNPSTSTPGGAS